MAKSVINIKTDKEIKRNAQKLAEELGLSLSDVLNASLRNFLKTRKVYFSSVPCMTPELERLLGTAEKDIKEKKNLSSRFSTREEVEDYFNSL
ncbi:MAG: type II toxin-antitoxin system RelB/DinJ family antitoxin [bacterium]